MREGPMVLYSMSLVFDGDEIQFRVCPLGAEILVRDGSDRVLWGADTLGLQDLWALQSWLGIAIPYLEKVGGE
jgi:hypothetical protein